AAQTVLRISAGSPLGHLTKGQATAGVSQQVRERGVGELGGVLVNAHLIRQLTVRRTKRDDAEECDTTVAQ
ncbi:MAG: hypothetical protein WCI12_06780, partial [Actinomycetes bacterium]